MKMLDVTLNGQIQQIPQGSNVRYMLDEMKLGKQAIVYLNGKKLLQKEYDVVLLQPFDELRIIKPLAGG